MSDSQLEARLRAWYRAEVGNDVAPSALRMALVDLPTASRRGWHTVPAWRPTVVAAAVVFLVLAGAALYALHPWRNVGGEATPRPRTGPSIDLSAGVPHLLTPQRAERVVLDMIARDEQRVGRAVVPARVTRITLLAPGEAYAFSGGGGVKEDHVSWAVEFEGTKLSCGSTCDLFSGGTIVLDDTGAESAGGFTGHIGPWPPGPEGTRGATPGVRG